MVIAGGDMIGTVTALHLDLSGGLDRGRYLTLLTRCILRGQLRELGAIAKELRRLWARQAGGHGNIDNGSRHVENLWHRARRCSSAR
ncbi:MAG: hypothetical protein M3O34_16915 [Chloroflexota bacterium]|nr:hypothetical protein [Chloroflexota bacterium]